MKSKLNKDINRRGQALVEAMVAISVLTVGYMGVIALLNSSLSLNRAVSDQYTASYLAAEGIEVVKNLLDSNAIQGLAWNAGVATGAYEVWYNTAYGGLQNFSTGTVYYNPTTHLYGGAASGGSATKFSRRVSIQMIGADEVRVISRINWTGLGGSTNQIEVEDHFLNWR